MTDAAVPADSAPAPVDGAPIDGGGFSAQPLGSQIPPDAQAKPESVPSVEDSIDHAMAKSAEAAKAPKPEAKTEIKPEPKEPAKPEQPRENGKFAAREGAEKPAQADPVVPATDTQPKPAAPASDAPARFSNDARAEWAKAPEPVKAEVARMERELTAGMEKYRASHEAFEPVREFHEMAKQGGTDLKTALSKYVGMENMLRADPVKGLEEICSNIGVSLRDVAAHILGQTPDQSQSRSDATIRELKQQVQALTEQVGGVTQTFQQQREQSTLTEINAFAAQNPRFEELWKDIAFFLETSRAKDLPEAYSLAERLNPAQAPASVVPAASSAAPEIQAPEAQTLAGQKSINGAPTAGFTSPGRKRAALSLDAALDKAFGQVG